MQLKSTLIIFFSFFSFFVNAQVIYVDSLAQGNNTGDSWEHAFTNLHDALNVATENNEIWVTAGTYFTDPNGNREVYFELKKGVALYGGFEGNESNKSQRDWELNQTILSGNIGDINNASDNAHTILYLENPDTNTIADGIIFSDANAQSQSIPSPDLFSLQRSGGGIYILANDSTEIIRPVIRNCIFRDILAEGGGALFFNGASEASSSVLIDNCIFSQNDFAGYGSAIYYIGGSIDYDIKIANCQFLQNGGGNFPNAKGGILRCKLTHGDKTIILDNCTFRKNNNFFRCSGLAIEIQIEAKIIIHNCLFEDNYVNGHGGILDFQGVGSQCFYEVQNCKFIRNKKTINQDESLISFYDFQYGCFVRCVLDDNMTNKSGVLIQTKSSDFFRRVSISVLISIITNNQGTAILIKSGDFFGGIGNSLALFSNLFYNNQAEEESGQSKSGVFVDSSYNHVGSRIFFKGTIFWDNSLHENGKLIYYPLGSTMQYNGCLSNISDCESIRENSSDCNFNQYNINPLFVNEAEGDFRVLPCSPTIDGSSITTDFDLWCDFNGLPAEIKSDYDFSFNLRHPLQTIGPHEAPYKSLESFNVKPVSCPGKEDGSVDFEIEFGCEPYFYEWDNGTTTGTGNTNLAPGDYTFTITDSGNDPLNFKDIIVNVTIPELPLMEISPIGTAVDCQNTVGGIATAIPEGGTPPYNFQWNTTQTDSVLTNLPAGEYTLTVTDANGCSQTLSIEITNEGNLSLGINVTKITCHDTHDGTATVTPVDGLAPFDFDWENGETDSVLINIGSGTYALTVTDALGCTDGLSFTIEAPDTLFAEVSGTDILCFGDQNGTAIADAEGGTEPYDFDWNNLMSGDTLTGLSPGEYWVTVTDQNGCRDSVSVSLSEPSDLVLATDSEGAPCFDSETGWASVTPTGGVIPYEYLWDNNQTDSVLTNLPGGEYPVTVTDSNDCTETTGISVHAPSEVTLDFESFDVSCFGFDDGTASVIPSGGTPPFMNEWNNLETDSVITDLSKGNYEVLVTDANDCMTSESIFIDAPDMLIPDSVTVHASSPGASDGMIIFQILSGGTPPFEYSWNTGDTTPSLSGIPPGEYILNVRDSNDCLTTYVFEVSFMSSVRRLNKENYRFYPNPVWQSQTVRFSFSNPNFHKGKLSIFDSKGSLIYVKNKVLNSNKIDFKSPETTGVFWVKFETENGFIITEKLVVLGLY